ncbi:hypothetical protein DF281_02410 [Kurthia zopfii]|nr:hypothetical protein DF281_02410 [Kurthia zopfii]
MKSWQIEILKSFASGYSNDFFEDLNNKITVMKCNTYGYK